MTSLEWHRPPRRRREAWHRREAWRVSDVLLILALSAVLWTIIILAIIA